MAIFSSLFAAASAAFAFLSATTILGVLLSTIALNVGVSVALTGISLLLNRQPKQLPGATPQAQATFNQAAGPRLRGYGRAKLGGTRAFWDSNGSGELYQAVMCHSGEIDEFEEFWIGDQLVTINPATSGINEPP